ncbi:MAG TPA: hypothetical protein VFQ52_08210, partial [Rhizomicrobium sp.]|nr:hypothetical protein [Rhizomicrobium sp.]
MSTAAIARDRLSVAVGHDRNVFAIAAHTGKVIAAQATQIVQRDEQLRIMARAHEVTRPSRSRKLARDWGSGNTIAGMDARQLRDQARHLDRDLDLATNALNVLVQNTVGSGIDVLS